MGDGLKAWLRIIGLQERISAFRAHAIEIELLADLSEADLCELGLTIGERKRFRRALIEEPPVGAISGPTTPERRPLTIMFVDLVGSSELAERLDSEDLLAIIQTYRECCGEAIERFAGTIARTAGDGILAYFSYPVAHENDPERAVRAALTIARNTPKLVTAAPAPLQVRIGIATGRVLISDLFAGGQADRRSILGSSPNLAQRLQTLARPGQVIISDETHDPVRHLFTYEKLGELAIRGFAEARMVWRVQGEAPHYGYRPGSRPMRRTKFCGRADELAVLMEHWTMAMQGNGSAVLLLGEAGIGKTRLAEAFLAEVTQFACTVVQLAASPFDIDSVLLPFRLWLRHAAGIEADLTPEERRARLQALIPTDLEPSADSVLALASALGVDIDIDPGSGPAMTAARLREQILWVIPRVILAQAAQTAVCLAVEDLHWLDPTSLELLQRLVRRVADRRMLILLTAREDFAASALTDSGVVIVPVRRLGAANTVEIAQHVLGALAPSPALLDQIVRKSDGVPLFVEEVACDLLGRRDQFDSPLPLREFDASVPVSVHELLMARLDRSGIDKEVAQAAAVIGRSARLDVLARVADLTPEAREARLGRLTEAGILVSERATESSDYSFAHALLRDAAYDSLPRDRRRALHVRAAEALQTLDPEGIEQQPELLALHLTEGGQPQAAVPHWIKAARRSLARWALTEATRLLQRGLAALDRLPSTEENAELRLQMTVLLGPALISLQGLGSREAQALYNGAYALCEAAPQRRFCFPIYWGWWRVSRDFKDSLTRARMLLARANDQGDPQVLLQAHHCNWAAAYFAGDLRSSHAHAEQGLQIYAMHDCTDHASIYGNHDPKVCAHGELAQILWMQGETRAALEQERLAEECADGLRHLGSVVHAWDMRLLHRIYRREFGIVFREATEFVEFTTEHGLVDHRAKGLIFRGWAVAMMGDVAAGLSMLEEGLREEREIAGLEDFPVYTALWAETLIKAGDHNRAIKELAKARSEFEQIGLRFWMPELIRLEGEATIAAASTASSLKLFESAMDLAQVQEAWMLHLRAAVSAARAHEACGCGKIGADLVSSALAMLSLQSDDQELVDARAFSSVLRN